MTRSTLSALGICASKEIAAPAGSCARAFALAVATFRCFNHSRMESESAGSRVSLLALRKDLPVHSFPG